MLVFFLFVILLFTFFTYLSWFFLSQSLGRGAGRSSEVHNLWLSNALLKAGNLFFFSFFSCFFLLCAWTAILQDLLIFSIPSTLVNLCLLWEACGGDLRSALVETCREGRCYYCVALPKQSEQTQTNLLLHCPCKLTLVQQWMLSRCGRVSEMENTLRHHPCRLGCAVLSSHCCLERSGLSAIRNGPLTYLTPQPEFLKAFLSSCNLRKSCMCPWLRRELPGWMGLRVCEGLFAGASEWEQLSKQQARSLAMTCPPPGLHTICPAGVWAVGTVTGKRTGAQSIHQVKTGRKGQHALASLVQLLDSLHKGNVSARPSSLGNCQYPRAIRSTGLPCSSTKPSQPVT